MNLVTFSLRIIGTVPEPFVSVNDLEVRLYIAGFDIKASPIVRDNYIFSQDN